MGETDWGGKWVFWWGGMLSKSSNHFSVDGWSWVLSLLFTWGQTMVEVMKIMMTSFKRSHACPSALSNPTTAGHHRSTPLLETPGHSRATLSQSLVGSLLLGPGSHKVLFVQIYKMQTNTVSLYLLPWKIKFTEIKYIGRCQGPRE